MINLSPVRFQNCVRDKLVRLYEFRSTANLNERFDPVDIEAIVSEISSPQIFALICSMKGPIAYIGGKNRIADDIIRIFPEHHTYVEVFAGGAQVLFHRKPAAVEVLNDLSKDVVTFFRVCQLHYEELTRYLKFIVTSRAWFELLQEQDARALTDVQRAARFFYLQKNAYAGLVRNRKFGYAVSQSGRFNPEHIPELIENTHKRLARVQIECLPYEEILRRYDRPTTLFYLDPPYFARKLYEFNFAEADFVELEKRLRRLRGKFVLSLNDVPDVRKIFRRFRFQEIDLAYTAQQVPGKRYPELLITNYPIAKTKPQAAA